MFINKLQANISSTIKLHMHDMTMSKVAKEQQCNLRKQFQHLQDDWDSYKQSIPRRRRRRSCSSTTLMADAAAALKLLMNSPKRLMCSLQQIQTPAADFSRPKPHDQEQVEMEDEIINDQKSDSTSRNNKLRSEGGRRLLEALDAAEDEACERGREETCSVSSSVLIQGAETTSSGSCSSCRCPLTIDKHVKAAFNCSSSVSDSLSSSSPSSLENVNQVEVGNLQRRSGNDGGVGVKSVMNLLVLLPIVIITLAFAFMLVKGFTEEEYECCIVPT